MSRSNDPGFGRGETFYSGRTIDTNNLEGTELEGLTKEFEDVNWADVASAKSRRTNRRVLCRLMRNMSGVALLGGRLAVSDTASPARVTGYAITTAQGRIVPVDEFLPSAGVPHGDLFWSVIKGPWLGKTTVAAQGSTVGQGDVMVAATGSAGSTAAAATTSECGRVAEQAFAAPTDGASTTAFVNQLRNQVGTAMSARTTAETNADILIDVDLRWGAEL